MIEILIYGITFLLCGIIIWFYLKWVNRHSTRTKEKVERAKEEGRFEPHSLHPYIDLNTCIGSGACVAACPEKDILGLVNGKATVINATSCVGHGACFHACPVEAISLKIGTESRGVELPHVDPSYQTNVPGIYIAGELGGMGLIKNSVEQGRQAVEHISKSIAKSQNDLIDLVIIGAGPAGISGALTAIKNQLSCVILEQDTLGGTVYSFPRSKIVMTHPMDLPMVGKIKLFNTSKDELLTIWKDAIQAHNIDIRENQKVTSIEATDSETFMIRTSSGLELESRSVLLAIGRRGSPRKLGVPGEDLPKVSYRLVDEEQIKGQHILVIGGGDSAVESALLLKDHNQVTLSYRKSSFSRIKPDNQKRIDQAIEDASINVIFDSTVENIKPDAVQLKMNNFPDQIVDLQNDWVYIFAGGELPISFLKNIGIEVTKRFGTIVKSHKK